MRFWSMLLAIPLLAGCGGREADPRGMERGETFLTVTATGRAEAKPDEARLSLGVQSQGASAAEAARANREKMDRVTATLGQLGVKGDDLQTRNLSLQRIDYGPERGRFRADNVVEVRMRDMNRVGEAVAGATDAGANLLGGPNLRVSDPEAATRSAYAEAYRAARARAEAYAGAANLAITRVVAIYDGGAAAGPIPHGRAMNMERGVPTIDAVSAVAPQEAAPPPPSVPFSAGVNRAEVQVRVDFALREQ
jgi:uncharacterized protein YggE